MTQQEIIELARQAGVEDSNEYDHLVCTEVEVVAFAKLIAEKEREACIAHAMTSAEKAIDVAIKLEREACAKTVEKIETYEKIEKACFKFAAKTSEQGDKHDNKTSNSQ